ncbi:MAG: hypothetical protein NWF04_02415 [Candidatus Bathyarchaeota archaeon]|nr:hypothetical protein [Candidatus Bathyarchaeota archaeon]
MTFKTAAVISCWLAVAAIASVYMIVFADQVGDIMFGVLLPVGALVVLAALVTVYINDASSQDRNA